MSEPTAGSMALRARRDAAIKALADRAGDFPELRDFPSLVRVMRAAGMSWPMLAGLVGRFTGIRVTGQTIRSWAIDAGVDPREPTSKTN